jgi:pantoate--beta-alanine ligase
MEVARTVADCRAAIAAIATRGGNRIGLVPTMGAFHDGHVALMRRARAECDTVVVSLFVNPTQFGDPRDLASYPRDEARDTEIAADSGVDLLFAPSVKEIYPTNATAVDVGGVADRLEGSPACRGPGHFRGVATVVTKLFNIVQPHVAYFGQKDAQQLAVIRRLVADLHLPIDIAAVPTVRDADGLALSSRNVRLSPIDRLRATSLHSALRAIASRAARGERAVSHLVEFGSTQLNVDQLDYLEIVDGDTFAPVDRVTSGALAVVAAHVGNVRLIDNLPLES